MKNLGQPVQKSNFKVVPNQILNQVNLHQAQPYLTRIQRAICQPTSSRSVLLISKRQVSQVVTSKSHSSKKTICKLNCRPMPASSTKSHQKMILQKNNLSSTQSATRKWSNQNSQFSRKQNEMKSKEQPRNKKMRQQYSWTKSTDLKRKNNNSNQVVSAKYAMMKRTRLKPSSRGKKWSTKPRFSNKMRNQIR